MIASDAGALPYVVEDGVTGLIFPRLDARALRSSALRLAEDADAAMRMGRQARCKAEKEFGQDAGFERLLAILGAARKTGGDSAAALVARGENHAPVV